MANVTVQKDRYTVDSLYQWDKDQELVITGLSLATIPEIHFTNDAMDKAIVRQSTMDDAGVITVEIPNSLLQKPYKIRAYVCIYEGETFKSLYLITIPVEARSMPADYTLTVADDEVYSFNALENLIINTIASNEKLSADVKNSNAQLESELKSTYNTAVAEIKSSNQTLENNIKESNETLSNEVSESNTALENELKTTYEAKLKEFNTISEDTVQECEDIIDETTSLLSARVDNLVANASNTDENSELIDGRVDYNGKTWPSIGVHIRAITGALSEKLQGNGSSESSETVTGTLIDYDFNVKAVNHRGYNTVAPENTIPAYILSKEKGFTYVEADVSFTSDDIAVLLHDSTIDRTSNGTGNVVDMTYNELLTYDFGSWKSSNYEGVKIPTFEEFILTCRGLGLHPYIEFKQTGNYTQEQITNVVEIVKKAGMRGKVTYISFDSTYLEYVKETDSEARLGFLSALNSGSITKAQNLMTGENDVFIDTSTYGLTDEQIELCIDAGIPLEVYTVNIESEVPNLHPYITGVTSDKLIAGKILYEKYMTYTAPESPEVPATGISLDKTALTFDDATSQTITATLEPTNTTDIVVWISSDETVAKVANGVVTPIAKGTCTITATAGSVSATCEVNVNVEEIVTYTITRNLIGCTSTSTVTSVNEGIAHSETITANSGYTLDEATVSITMDDIDISSNYVDGVLTIDSVTGNIVISVSAVEEQNTGYTFLLELTSEDMILGGLTSETPYYSTNTSRVSYIGGEIPIESGYTYKVEFEGNLSNIGVQQYNQNVVDAMLQNINYTTSDVKDSGWKESGYEFTQLTVNGLGAVGCFLTFKNSSNTVISVDDLTTCKIYRKSN